MAYETKTNYCTNNLQKANEKRKKKVACILGGEIIKVYASLAEVEKDGFTFSLVGMVCRNKRNHHKGYGWKYI